MLSLCVRGQNLACQCLRSSRPIGRAQHGSANFSTHVVLYWSPFLLLFAILPDGIRNRPLNPVRMKGLLLANSSQVHDIQARALIVNGPSPSKHSPHPPVPRTPNNTVPTLQKCPLPHKRLNFPPENRPLRGSPRVTSRSSLPYPCDSHSMARPSLIQSHVVCSRVWPISL